MTTPFNIYPRPQLKRESFICLNGEWDLAVTQSESIPQKFDEKITVPYVPQSRLSGIGRQLDEDDILFYRRHFDSPDLKDGEKLILHFGAVDTHAEVFLNGCPVAKHSGGYLPFSVDITEHIQNKNELVVKVVDTLDHDYPYGKQRYDRGGMWYTPISGIWQTVWMEIVPKHFIRSLKTDVSLTEATIIIDTDAPVISAELIDDEGEIGIKGKTLTVRPRNVKNWFPESPYLYRLKITADSDSIETYFALRTLEIKTINGTPRMCLNGNPYFFHGLLDQGYFEDGIFLPETPEGFTHDVEAMKALGFNTLRKHIKIEPECFYYDCDRLGMIVFQDFVNNSDYSFFRDTALPTVGIKRISDKHLKRTKKAKEIFESHSKATVEHLYNHPSICLWTVFNEGWGQFDADRMFALTKEWDNSRFVDATSGWFSQNDSDLDSLHVYFKKFRMPKSSSRPVFLSEFGGYSYGVRGHLYDENKSYGYKSFKDLEDFKAAFIELYEEQIIPNAEKGLCASIYTQVSDVEEEINGIMTYDRQVIKLTPEEALPIAEKLKKAVL